MKEVEGKKKSLKAEENPITAQELNDYFVENGSEFLSGFQKKSDFSKIIANKN